MNSRIVPVLLFALGCASAGGLPPEALALNQAGAAALAETDGGDRVDVLDEAEARFRLALEYNPGFVEPRANIGLVMLERGDLPAAEDHYRAAIAIDPDFDEAWCGLGVVLRAAGELLDAAAAFERALAIDPGRADARWNLALVWLERGAFAEARAQLMRLAQLPALPPAERLRSRAALAYAELRLGRRHAAARRAQGVLAVDPDEPHALFVRGVLDASTRPERALDDLSRAAETAYLRFAASLRIGAILVATGDLRRAGPVVGVLLDDAPDDLAVLLLAAHFESGGGDLASARVHLERAGRLHPHSEAVRHLLANLDRELDPVDL